jgi:hypothetical protein
MAWQAGTALSRPDCRLAAVKKRLAHGCPEIFRRQIEAACEKMWQTWLAGKPAEGFGPTTSARER